VAHARQDHQTLDTVLVAMAISGLTYAVWLALIQGERCGR
jgi:hypothetical protein